MHRLFSSFPNASPGAGLLLLRLTLAGMLFANAAVALQQSGPAPLPVLALAGFATGTALVVGAWTPLVAAIVCLLELGAVLLAEQVTEPQLLRGAIGLSLALLGPGAFSIDARWFGRRRVEITQVRDD